MKNKLKIIILFISLYAIFFSGCSSSISSNQTANVSIKKFSSAEMKEDLDYLLETFEQVHPNLYTKIPKKVFDSNYVQVKGRLIDSMTVLEFYKLVLPLVSEFGDGHTNLNFPYECRQQYLDNGGKIVPFEIRIDGDRLYIRQNYSSDSALTINSEILSINGIPAKELLINLRKYQPGESIEYVNEYVQRMFKPLIWIHYGFGNQFNVEYISSKDSVNHSGSLSGITLTELNYLSGKLNKKEPSLLKWTFQKLNEADIALIDLNSFGRAEDLDTFERFLDSTFTILKNEKIENLVIDVRGNSGGDNIIGEAIINYIANKPWALSSKTVLKLSSQVKSDVIPWYLRWMPARTLFGLFSSMYTSMDIEKIEETEDSTGCQILTAYPEPMISDNPLLYKGNVYVLINHGSYSMSVIFASVMQDYKIATLIGEETGQDANPYGFLYSFKLPVTKLNANVPAARSFRPSGKIDGHGVIPDFEVKQRPEDLVNNTDTVLEFTKKLIRNKNNSIIKSDKK